MPQLQVVDLSVPKDEPNIIDRFAQGAIDRYSKNREQAKVKQAEEEDTLQIKDAFSQYKRENFELQDAIQDLQTRPGISPKRRIEAVNTMLELQKTNNALQKETKARLDKIKVDEDRKTAEKAKTDAEAQKLARTQQSVKGIYADAVADGLMDEKDAEVRSKYDSEATARATVKDLREKKKPAKPEPKSEFQKVTERKNAEELHSIEQAIPKAKDALANLDYIEQEFNNNLTGISGYAKAAYGSKSAKEVESIGFTAIEPIIKLFNPVGPIPVQKLKIIREQFQPNAWDNRLAFSGKIAALRRIGQQGLARAQERANILKRYNGNPPPGEIESFDAESDQLQTVLIDREGYQLATRDLKPDDPVVGLWDKKTGRLLKGIPKKEADKFMQQGLVTYVQP